MYDNAFINLISKRRSKHLLHQKCKLQWFLKLVWRHFKANNGQVYQRWLKFTCSLPNMAKDNLKITLKITALNIFGHLWGSPEPLHKFRKDIWRLYKDNQRSPENCWRFSNIIPKARGTFPKIAADLNQFKRQTWHQWNNRYLHMWEYHIFTCEDIVSICYHSVYRWLLYNKFTFIAHLTGRTRPSGWK